MFIEKSGVIECDYYLLDTDKVNGKLRAEKRKVSVLLLVLVSSRVVRRIPTAANFAIHSEGDQ